MVTSILSAITRQGFVDGVVDDFVDEVMESDFAGRADVHGGALADRFHAAEDFDGVGIVIAVSVSAVLVLRVGVLDVGELGIQFFGGHSSP